MNDIDDLEFLQDTYDTIEAAIKLHATEIRGIPMSAHEIIARFVIYASILYNFYEMSDEEIVGLFQFSKRMQPITMSVPHVSGKPN